MKKFIVAGNWKMNTDLEEAKGLFTEVKNIAKDELKGKAELIVFPPFTHLNNLKHLNDSSVKIGAQNICWEEKGAYTGEVSAAMVFSAGATYVILGHSERRLYFSENNELLSKKLQLVLAHKMTPVFCVGETKEERQQNIHIKIILEQLKGTLFQLESSEFSKVVIAYEPVWAIGTGLTATAEQAQEIHFEIRNVITKHYSADLSANISILYGGSCTSKNADDLFSQPDIDGGLIGGASLKPREFIEIARILENRKH